MVWINQKEALPGATLEVLVRYNKRENGTFGDKELGNRQLIKELYENGWETVEWLDEEEVKDKDCLSYLEVHKRLVAQKAKSEYKQVALRMVYDAFFNHQPAETNYTNTDFPSI